MSPASYLAAPPRVAGAIVAPSVTIVSHDVDDLGRADCWLSRGARGAIGIPRRADPPGRGARSSGLRRHLGKELERLADARRAAPRRTPRARPTQTKLDESLARLRVALARFAVLREALDEATGDVRPLHRRSIRASESRRGRPRHEHDAAARRRRRRRPRRRGAPRDAHHPARRRRRRAQAASSPLPIARVRNALSDYRRTLESPRRRAHARSSRRARCATRRTARRSSARSSGATASRRGSSAATRRRS